MINSSETLNKKEAGSIFLNIIFESQEMQDAVF